MKRRLVFVGTENNGKVTITLKKSLIGYKKDQIETAHSLGLRKIGSSRDFNYNKQVEGKIRKISHLVSVTKH